MKADELLAECKILHPGYTDEQMYEWIEHTLKTHPNSLRKRIRRCFSERFWLWIWRIAALLCLLAIALRRV